MKKNLLIVFAVTLCINCFAQQGATKWKASIEPQKVFIENKGQFDGLGVAGKVLFGTDGYASVFLFTKNGLCYRLERREVQDKDAQNEVKNFQSDLKSRSQNKPDDYKIDEDHNIAMVNMQWENSNPNAEVVAVDETPSYFNFGMAKGSIDHVKTFHKIVYKNLYDNIDVEYVFHPKTGIEYSLILHPGADISKVKMKYYGADKLSLSDKGEIHISTSFGDIVDHAPVAFYSGDKTKGISSSFDLERKRVSFKLGNYDKTQTLIIDPWTTPPGFSLPNTNRAFYIKSDSLGNAYVYGGTTPFTLLKYSNAGSLVWTYSTTWDTANAWFGCLAVDRAGNSYITAGSIAAIARINTGGSQDWINSPGGILNSTEYWSIDFNCDQTQMIVGGTDFNGASFLNGYVFNINMNSGAQLSKVWVGGLAFPNINEGRALCFSPNGNYYFLTLDTIGSITPGMVLNFETSQSYNFSYYNQYGYGFGQGHNGIRASLKYLYTSDGLTLDQRDLYTGAIIKTVSIPGGVAQKSSGIAIDTCGNVYVGSSNAVVKYDLNLNYLSTASTPSAVFDVSIATNGDVLACGQSFAVALAMTACPQIKPICYSVFQAKLNQASPQCFGQCTGTATASTVNGTGPYNYLWSNNATTQTISNLCAGTYTVTITDQSNNSTAVASTVISTPVAITVSAAGYNPSCSGTNGKVQATVTSGGVSPFTYSWTGGGTGQIDSNLAAGTYVVTVNDVNHCSVTASATLSQSGGLSLTPASTVASCSSNNGTATVTVTGGNPPFAYNWSNGQKTATITGLAAGNYTVTVSDTASSSNGAFWVENFSNGGTGWTFDSAGVGKNGSAPNVWTINNDNSCNCDAGSTFLHITCNPSQSSGFFSQCTAGTCTYLEKPGASPLATYNTDQLAISPLISTIGKTSMVLRFRYECLGLSGSDYGLIRLSSDGGLTWTALNTPYVGVSTCTTALVNIPSNYENISNFKIAFEWINVDGNLFTGNGPYTPGFTIDSISLTAGAGASCPGVATVTVGSSSGLALTTTSSSAICGQNNGSATVSITAGTGPFSYKWSTNDTTQTISNLPGGNYSVTVTGSGNCNAVASVSVTATGSLALTTTPTATTCGTDNGSATANPSGGSGNYTYLWSNNATTQTISNVAAGNYTVTVTGSGCSATSSASVASSTGLSVSISTTPAGCNPTGTATATPSGGANYIYNWSSGTTTSQANNLSGGNYSVTVNSNGCSVSGTATVGTTGGGIGLSSSSTAATCGNNNGTATVTTTAGTGPFTYAWSNSGTSASISNLAAGNYTVTVTGSGGCVANTVVTVPAGAGLTVTPATTSTTCGLSNGAASITVSGGSGNYSYTWSNSATTAGINNLASGNYTVTVNDNAGCTVTSTVSIGSSGPLTATINTNKTIMCPNDNATICATGTFSSYSWNTGDSTQCITTSYSGNYVLTATDNGGCQAVSNQVSITNYAPVPVTVSVNGDTLTSYSAVTYQWYYNGQPIPGDTTAVIVATHSGAYSVHITDQHGCIYTSSPTNITGLNNILADDLIKVYPNPLSKGNWHVDISEAMIGSVCEVFDADGRLVYRNELKSVKSEISLEVAAGVYMMQIHSAQINYNLKLIKLF